MVTVGTDSYASEAELAAYALARGVDLVGDATVLLIQAMDWLESQPFIGYRTVAGQALCFPRSGFQYPDTEATYFVPTLYNTTIPPRIKQAQIVAALLIDGGASLLGAVDRAVKSEKVGDLAVEYMDNAGEATRYPQLTMLLRGFVASGFVVSRG